MSSQRSQLERLAKPFPSRLIHDNPSGGGSYVKHSVVTEKLLAVVGPFSFELVQIVRGRVEGTPANPQGSSARAKRGTPDLDGAIVGAVCALSVTIDGAAVRIEEVGDCEQPHNWPHDGARLKDAMSDALKRCAMRVGVTLHLWSGAEFSLYDQLVEAKEDLRADEQSGSPLGDDHATTDAAGDVPTGAPPVATPAPKGRIDLIREQVVAADLTAWVKDQGFPWPWTPAACAAIGQKVRDVHIERFAASPNVSPEAPPVSADAPPVRDGRMLPSYATVPTESVELPPCAEDAEEVRFSDVKIHGIGIETVGASGTSIVCGPVTEPGPGQVAGNASAGVLSEVEIAAEVRGMPVEAVRRALNGAGLSIDGTTSELRKRLVAFRTSEEPF